MPDVEGVAVLPEANYLIERDAMGINFLHCLFPSAFAFTA
jgi:hypothetical protein